MEIKLFEQVKQIMTACSLKQADLASVLEVSLSRVKALTTDRVKKLDQAEVKALVGKLNLDANWLATGEGEMFQSSESKPATSSPSAPEGFILVPHYEVQASAGHGSLIHSEQIVDYLAFKADWVRNTLGVAQKDLALISVKGDSMEPVLSNEDLILVDMRKNRVEDNAIYVLQLNDALLVKRIQHKLDGSLHVMSDNKHYDTEIVSAERAADLNVLGRVVWSGRRM